MYPKIRCKFWLFCWLLLVFAFSQIHSSHQSVTQFAAPNEGSVTSSRRHSLVTTDHHIHPYPPTMAGTTGAGGSVSATGATSSPISSMYNHLAHHHYLPQHMMMMAPMAPSAVPSPAAMYGANMYMTPYYPTQPVFYHSPMGNVVQTGYHHPNGHTNPMLGSMFGAFGPSLMPQHGMPPPRPPAPEVQHILLDDIPTDTDFASDPYYSASSSHHPSRFLSYSNPFSDSDLFGSPSSKVYRKKGPHKGRSRQKQTLYKDDYEDDYDPYSSKARKRLKSAKQYPSLSLETFDDDGEYDDFGFRRRNDVDCSEGKNCK